MAKKTTSSGTRKTAPKAAARKAPKKPAAKAAPPATDPTLSVLDGPMKSIIQDAFLKRNR